jgi:bifunctional non-homologous end joining protein LigD
MAFQPMPLSRRALPFDHPEWIFELKYDGFRSLAVIHDGRAQLISRNGNPFNSFADLCKGLTLPLAGKTVLDGEIVCLDKRGRPQFRDLLFHRGESCFFAFDLLMADGKDLRSERLTDRKQELRRLMLKAPTSRMHYADHIEQHGTALFQRVPQWSPQKRPMRVTSKPANGKRPGTQLFYPAACCGGKSIFVRQLRGPHLST